MASIIQLAGVAKVYDGAAQPALDGVEPRHRGRPHHRGHGAVGLRQVDAPQPRRGARPSDPGRGPVDGVRVDRLGEAAAARFRRANVGFIFQFFHLLDDLTVRDNVAVAAQLAGASSATAPSASR